MFPVVLVSLAAALVPPPSTFRPDYKDKPLTEIVEEIEQRSGLMFISRSKPTGMITLKVDRNVTTRELIGLLNEQLEPREVGFYIKEMSFTFLVFAEAFDSLGGMSQRLISYAELDQLDRYHKLEIKSVVLPLPKGANADETHTRMKKLLGKWGDISAFGTDKLLVTDQVKNLRAVRDALADTIKK